MSLLILEESQGTCFICGEIQHQIKVEPFAKSKGGFFETLKNHVFCQECHKESYDFFKGLMDKYCNKGEN